jgi:hypothetical protein
MHLLKMCEDAMAHACGGSSPGSKCICTDVCWQDNTSQDLGFLARPALCFTLRGGRRRAAIASSEDSSLSFCMSAHVGFAFCNRRNEYRNVHHQEL